MIDHVGFAVGDADRSRRFYEQALAPLGISLIMSVTPEQTESGGTAHGFGSDGKPYFWVGDNERVGEGTHVAFAVEDRAMVDAFHAAGAGRGRAGQWRAGASPALRARLLCRVRARSGRQQYRGGMPSTGLKIFTIGYEATTRARVHRRASAGGRRAGDRRARGAAVSQARLFEEYPQARDWPKRGSTMSI